MTTLYSGGDTYLLETNEIDDVIVKADAYMMPLPQLSAKSPMKSTEELWTPTARWDRVYEDHVLKGILLKDCRIWSTIVCIHIDVERRLLKYKIWRAMHLC